MRMKMCGVIVGALLMASGVFAKEKVLFNWSAKDWSGKGFEAENVDGKSCLVTIKGSGNKLISKRWFPVEAGKKYILAGTFKSLGKVASTVHYGFACYDQSKRYIPPRYVRVVKDSATILVKSCKAGDKKLIIATNNKWKANQTVAFNVKNDFSDIPNREVSFNILKVVPRGENMEIQLSRGVSKAYFSGTKLRVHAGGSSYTWTACRGKTISHSWESYTGTASIGKIGQEGAVYLLPGTAFVKLGIVANYKLEGDVKLAITDLTLKVTE